MNKFTKLSLATLVSLLTACSGGGGSSDNKAPQAETPKQEMPAPSNPEPPSPSNPTPTSSPVNGYAYSLSGSNLTIVGEPHTLKSDKLNTLNVDNKVIELLDPTDSIRWTEFFSTNSQILSGTHVTYLRYGIVPSGVVGQPKNEVFVQGESTKNMPTSGIAVYSGLAAFFKPRGSDLIIDYTSGNSMFNVDFANKTLVGTVSTGGTSLSLEAKINGNTFEGTNSDAITTKGGFYGPNAAELGGVFHAPKANIIGAYGATR